MATGNHLRSRVKLDHRANEKTPDENGNAANLADDDDAVSASVAALDISSRRFLNLR